MRMALERAIIIKIQSLSCPAEDWELYTSSYPEDCERAAAEFNDKLVELVNGGATRQQAEKGMFHLMSSHNELGAMDTEPQWRLRDLLDKIYGKED